MRYLKWLIPLALALALAGVVILPAKEGVLGSYATSLQGRTPGQRHNALRAAVMLNGLVIGPGQLFSFNRTLGTWSADRGYVKAPVSFDGELIVDWGGGVCQTSSTLYNAALIAGMEIKERHRHAWAPKYVPPGRDAAVAQHDVDLRFRNPYAFPVQIHTQASEEGVGFTLTGKQIGPMASVEEEIRGKDEPAEVIKTDANPDAPRRRVVTHGRPGVRVAIYRTFLRGPLAGHREMVANDSYPAMNRVVAIRVP